MSHNQRNNNTPTDSLDLLKVAVWLGVLAFGAVFWWFAIPAIIGAIHALQTFAVPGAF
jgi:hypothetical protein